MLYYRSGPWFKSKGVGQLRVLPTMGWRLTPLRHEPRPHKDRATTTVAIEDREARANWT
jgi:hypothetical protein